MIIAAYGWRLNLYLFILRIMLYIILLKLDKNETITDCEENIKPIDDCGINEIKMLDVKLEKREQLTI